jgi:BirA family biotin operon repressor/biotin-[acetyl-CoA-carboxylase] ligase
MVEGRLDIERIVGGLTLARVGRSVAAGPNVQILDSVPSTNDLAWTRVGEPAADGFVVFAEQQTHGRGRLGRRWESPRGASLLCSVLLHDSADGRSKAPPGAQLSLLAAVAAHDAVADATGVQIEIKWPNDLLAAGRKVGGVLVESRPLTARRAADGGEASVYPTVHVVGIGINCLQQPAHFPPGLRERATSLDLVTAQVIDRNDLARALLVHLDRWLSDSDAWGGQWIRQAWLERAAPLGSRIKLQHSGQDYAGHVVDLDPTASLLVQLDSGERRLFDAATTTVINE